MNLLQFEIKPVAHKNLLNSKKEGRSEFSLSNLAYLF